MPKRVDFVLLIGHVLRFAQNRKNDPELFRYWETANGFPGFHRLAGFTRSYRGGVSLLVPRGVSQQIVHSPPVTSCLARLSLT